MKIKEANRIILARTMMNMKTTWVSSPLSLAQRLKYQVLLNLYARILKRSSENSTTFILLKLEELELSLSDVLYLLRVYYRAGEREMYHSRGGSFQSANVLALWEKVRLIHEICCLVKSGQVISR